METPENELPEGNAGSEATVVGLHFSPQVKEYLFKTAKWMKTISIIGFVFSGLMALGGIGMMVAGTNGMGLMAGFSILYLLLAGIYFLPFWYLFNSAKGLRISLEYDRQDWMEHGVFNLFRHYRFIGILCVIICIIYPIAIIGMILGKSLI